MLEEPDRVPIFELWMNYPVFKSVLGREGKYDDNVKIFYFETTDMAEAYGKLGLDAIPIVLGGPSFFKPIWMDDGTYIDYLGRHGKIVRNYDWLYIGPGLRTLDEISELPLDPNLPGWMDPVKDAIKAAEKYRVATVGIVYGVLDEANLAFGMDRFLPLLYRDPDSASKVMSRFAQLWTCLAKQMIELGVDAILCADDIAYKHGPMLSPEVYRKRVMPFHRQIANAIKSGGLPAIFHSDGNLYPVIDDLISAGFDGLLSIEPIAGMDIGVVKEKWGDKLFLVGNIDCSYTLTMAPLEKVVEETKETISKASPGGGHILSSSNSLHSATNIQNYLTMIRTAKKYGKYPIK